jgi:hypothetical protein
MILALSRYHTTLSLPTTVADAAGGVGTGTRIAAHGTCPRRNTKQEEERATQMNKEARRRKSKKKTRTKTRDV